ncbi:MAG: lysozyme inhibitor LprI family protein [Beijerinckiaceae bacterium]|nr:lysozyme inhibitor LprI family protein [Beijerinckiaceae bacterium]
MTALLLAAGAAKAQVVTPSFSCAKATAPVDAAICGDATLAGLDVRLEQAFRAALKRGTGGKSKLRDDQRRWLANRAKACHIADDGDTPAEAPGCLVELYTARLAVLNPAKAEFHGPLCQSVAKTIESDGGYLENNVWNALTTGLGTNPASPVHFESNGRKIDRGDVAAYPGLDPSAGLANTIVAYEFGPKKTLTALETTGGTANCKKMYFFANKGADLAPLEGPPQANEGMYCWNASIFVGETVGSDPVPVFAVEDFEPRLSTLILWTRRGSAWQAACQIKANYSADIVLSESFSSGGEPSADLKALALAAARARDTNAEQFSPPTPDGMKPLDGAAPKGGEDRELPLFGREAKSNYTTFAEGAPFYTGQGPSGPIVLRVSHGTIGWRMNEGYIVAIYEKRIDTLTPVASFIFEKNRVALKSVTAGPISSP